MNYTPLDLENNKKEIGSGALQGGLSGFQAGIATGNPIAAIGMGVAGAAYGGYTANETANTTRQEGKSQYRLQQQALHSQSMNQDISGAATLPQGNIAQANPGAVAQPAPVASQPAVGNLTPPVNTSVTPQPSGANQTFNNLSGASTLV